MELPREMEKKGKGHSEWGLDTSALERVEDDERQDTQSQVESKKPRVEGSAKQHPA